MLTTRFAPSPTGLLHLGHAFAALVAADAAQGGRFVLRIEDLDRGRARAEYEQAICEDLRWLGLSWHEPLLRQSERSGAYRAALAQLAAREVLYPCFCTRAQIAAEIARALEAPQGPEAAAVYPRTCRALTAAEREQRIASGAPYALRLDTARAAEALPALTFAECGAGPDGQHGPIAVQPSLLGDVVLARKDVPASYHLAVVVDDAFQDITLVTRGNDLYAATHVQRLLQALLGLPAPRYAHHRLILDAQGQKLSKRDRAISLRSLREGGASAQDIRQRLECARSPPAS
ncbi:MAG: tRNA glutamyl-Q(34) synthetase GluQRS [Steroidobacteraceae bacterium]